MVVGKVVAGVSGTDGVAVTVTVTGGTVAVAVSGGWLTVTVTGGMVDVEVVVNSILTVVAEVSVEVTGVAAQASRPVIEIKPIEINTAKNLTL